MDPKIFNATWKGIGLQHYSIQDLISSYDDKGYTGLHRVACFGHLDKISGGVTASQLAAVISSDGQNTALHIAAGFGHLDQIKGGVTAGQLLSVPPTYKFRSPLTRAAHYCHLDQITGGVTADQLAKDRFGRFTALHQAALDGALDQITGGVSVTDVLTMKLPDVVEMALYAGHLDQFTGGTSLAQLSNVRCPDRGGMFASHVVWIITIRGEADVENTLVGCPDAVEKLDPNNAIQMKALRKALTRNRAIEPFLTGAMAAAML